MNIDKKFPNFIKASSDIIIENISPLVVLTSIESLNLPNNESLYIY